MNKYERYIASDEWREKRKLVMERAGGICEKCTKRQAKQVHHLTYKNLFDEPLKDLQAVCLPCHQAHHPDKKILSRGYIYTGELDCEQCPSVVAEFFVVGRNFSTFCPHCGATTRGYRGRPPKRYRVHRKAGVPCPECGKFLASAFGVRQHRNAIHC